MSNRFTHLLTLFFLIIATQWGFGQAQFSADKTVICPGDTVTFFDQSSGNITTWNWSFPGGIPSSASGQGPHQVVYTSAGSYTVSLTVSGPQGSDTETKPNYIVVKTPPQPGIISLSGDTICSNQQHTYFDTAQAGHIYQWFATNGFVLFAQSGGALVQWNGPGTGQLTTLVIDTITGCSTTVINEVEIRNPNLNYFFTQTPPDTVCPATTVNVSVNNISGTTYYWSVVPDGIILSGQGTPNASVLLFNSGINLIQVYPVNPSQNCQNVISEMVFIEGQLQNIQISSSNGTGLCPGDSTVLDAGTHPSFHSYLWSNGATTQTITVNTSGTYYVNTYDANGCLSGISDTVVVTILNQTPAITGPVNVCEFTVGHVYRFSFNPGPNYTAHWSVNGGFIRTAAADSVVIDWGASGTGRLIGWLENPQNGCVLSPDTLYVSIEAPTAPFMDGPDTVCQFDVVTYTITNDISGSYNWIVNSGTILSGQGTSSVTVEWHTSGIGYIEANELNATICPPGSTSKNVRVKLKPNPVITLVGSNQLCAGDSAILSAPPGFAHYQWSNGATTQSIIVTSTGDYYVVVDLDGCIGVSDTVGIVSDTIPSIPYIIGPTSVCVNSTNVPYIRPIQNRPNMTYTWAVSSHGSIVSGNEDTVYINWNSPGTAYITILSKSTLSGCFIIDTFYINVDSALVPTISGPDGICPGESVTLDAGFGYNTYLWSTGESTQIINVTQTGTYSVTVTDVNNCNGVASKTLIAYGGVDAIIIPIDENCGQANGQMTVDAISGTSPFSYLWSTGATTASISNLSAGVYSVTVTDLNGCSVVVSDTIQNLPGPSLSASINDVSCNGFSDGAIDLQPSGGASPYTYLWSNSSTQEDLLNVPAGSYTVTVTDQNNCTVTGTFTVSQPPVLNASVTTVDATCSTPGSATVSPNGGTSPYSYLWSNGQTTASATGLQGGTYTVTITDANNCSVIKTAVINTIGGPSLTTSHTDVSCFGGSDGSATVSASGGAPPYSYMWSIGLTTASITGLIAGTYTVTVTDTNQCSNVATVVVNQPPAINIVSSVQKPCYNSSNGAITLTVSGGTGGYTYQWSTGATTQNIFNIPAGTYDVTVTDNSNCTATASIVVTQNPQLNGSANRTHVSCFGGSDGAIDITVTGGTPPYSYQWNTGATTEDISGLQAGTYRVTVHDANNCSLSAPFTINQPADISLSFTSQDEHCDLSDGSATVTATGGTPPYTYQWSSGASTSTATGLSGGLHSVTVQDSKGCVKTGQVFINTLPGPSLSIQKSEVSCAGGSDGSLDLTVTQGTPPYSYQWSNGATTEDLNNIPSGTYTVTVTDANGCTVSLFETLTDPQPLTLLTNVQNVSCRNFSDGSIDLIVFGGVPPYTYQWSSGQTTQDITNIPAGIYTVTVTDNRNCTQTISDTVTQPPALGGNILSGNVSCYGGNDGFVEINPTGGTPPYSYLWSSGHTTEDITGLVAGTYSVTVTDANGCTISATKTIQQPPQLQISATISDETCNAANGSIQVTVTGGVVPYAYTWSNGATTPTLVNLNAGIYRLTVTDANNCTKTANYVVNNSPGPVLSFQVTAPSCASASDGGIDMTVTSGTPPFIFQWSNGATTEDITGLTPGVYYVTVSDSINCVTVDSVEVLPVLPLNIQVSVSDVSCFNACDGSAQITVTGGTPPYQFSLNNGPFQSSATFTNLCADTFTVDVVDSNGCTGSGQFIIHQPDELVVTFTVQNASCGQNDGSATAHLSGGTPPYRYDWSNGATSPTITGLSPGCYVFTGTDFNQCTISGTVCVASNCGGLTVTLNVNPISCRNSNDGAIFTSVTGGVPPYTYHWSTSATTASITGLGPGTYTVTVTDQNGDTASASATLVNPPALGGSVSKQNVSCYGYSDGSITITPSGGTPPYSFLWSTNDTTPTISNLPAGNYSVTLTDDHGCSISASISINQPAAMVLTANITHASGPSAMDGAIDLTVTNGVMPLSYQWSTGNTSEDLSGLSPGTYCVTVTDANGCTATDCFTVSDLASCPPVTGLFVDRITPVRARLRWTPNTGASGYQIRGRAANSSNWVYLIQQGGNSDRRDVFGLYYNVTYVWQIRAFCNGTADTSVWSVLDTFVTQCQPTDSVWTSPVTANAARFNWLRVFGAVGYEIRGRKLGGPWINITVPGGTTVFKDVYGLKPSTMYMWKIRTWCDVNGVAKSVYSETDTFVTASGSKIAGLNDPFDQYDEPMLRISPNPSEGNIICRLREDVMFTDSQLEIFDITGKRLKSIALYDKIDWNSHTVVLDLGFLDNGIYQLRIRNDFDEATYKIIIAR